MAIDTISTLLMNTPSLHGYILGNKSEAFQIFCNFKTQVELQLGLKIKNLQFWVGGEYRSFTNFLNTNGIHYRISCPGSHQRNGIPERKHRRIVEYGLTLLANASVPLKFWDEAFKTSVYLINRLPCSSYKVKHHLKLSLTPNLSMKLLSVW